MAPESGPLPRDAQRHELARADAEEMRCLSGIEIGPTGDSKPDPFVPTIHDTLPRCPPASGDHRRAARRCRGSKTGNAIFEPEAWTER